MVDQSKLVSDGTLNFAGGQNASVSPFNIADNQYYLGINLSTQKGSLRPRWGLTEKKLDWSKAGNYKKRNLSEVSFQYVFETGKFQGFIPYSIGPDFFVIYIISGFLFLIEIRNLQVTVLNPLDKVDPTEDRINWSPAGNFLVVFDFPNVPFILKGFEIHRADQTKNEVPVSRLGTYNQNRLGVANAGHDFTFGDPAGSIAAPNAPTTFNEVNLPSTGFTDQVFQLTTNYANDDITAMGFLQVADTSLGIGPCLVSSRRAIYSYRTDLPRSQWGAGQFGSVLLYNAGIVGQRAQVNVNSDLLFLSPDGQIRALTMSRNEQGRWSNVPISREVGNFLHKDEELDKYAVLAYHQNKIFITCNPYRLSCQSAEGILQTDIAHGGVVVLELDNISGLTQQSNPVWAGLWTGTRFLDMCQNNDIFYVAGKQDGINCFYVFDPDTTYDLVDGKQRDIRSVIYTKEYSNGDLTNNKTIHNLELGLRDIEEKLDVNVCYRPSHAKNFQFWKQLNFVSEVGQCQGLPMFPNGLSTMSPRDLNLGGVSDDGCTTDTKEGIYKYKTVQLRITLTGKNWELDYIKLKGRPILSEELEIYCEQPPKVPVPLECFDYWYIPSTDC